MHSGASVRPPGIEPPPLRHKNNFDLLRFVFAFTVLLVHSFALSRETELQVFTRFLSAEVAIQGFFVVSGYLVFMSLENSRSVGDYLVKRVRRIYPAYFAVVAGCALLGVLVSTAPVAQYFSGDLVRYLAANLVFLNFLEPNLPGVFRANPMSEVNGALWTLKIEVMFYAAVPVIAWLGARLGRGRTLLALYLLAAAYVVGMDWLHRRTGSGFYLILQRQLPGQLGFFLAGAACYYYADALAARWRWIVPFAAIALLAGQAWWPLKVLVLPAAFGALVVYAAVGMRHLGNFGKYGDLSYGIYILHFPVIQWLVSIGLYRESPFGALAATIVGVLALAFASWHFVEKPFLRKTSHYVVAEQR
jgi:peptidoglycan/LPS O-acetylase OafA/YrhL